DTVGPLAMLVGRQPEVERIDRLLASARASTSAALLLRGDAGMGKTALLEHAARAADGMTTLRSRAVESETELPFSGLHELVVGRGSVLDALPAPQAEALAGALSLRQADAPPDRFTIYAGVLSLLAAIAEERPVLVLVDDAHWL